AELVASTTRALQQAGGAPEPGRQPSRRNRMSRIARLASIAVAATVLLAVGVFFALRGPGPSPDTRAETPGVKASAEVEVDGTAYHVQGPFTHQDLTVFLLCSDRQDGHDFLTLDEGLKEGLVTITEQERERVGALRID